MRRKLAAVVAVVGVGGVLALPSGAGADRIKTCIEEGKNKNWTEVVTQQTGCPSDPAPHPDETVEVQNGGGQTPPGQQP